MRIEFFSAGILAAALTLAPASKGNLLVNGGFEQSNNGFSETQTPEGWTNVGHVDGVIAYSVFNTPAYNGLYYYDLGGYGQALPGSGDGIEQTVATSAGSKYALTFGYSNENAPNFGPEFLNVLINGTNVDTIAMMYNGTYGEFQIPFTTLSLDYTAASASTTILFTVTGTNLGGQDPLIDGISFDQTSNTGTPEPGTYFTGFIGLGLLAMRLIPKTTRMLSK